MIDWESQKDFKPLDQEEWRDKVNLGNNYADHRPRVLKLLQPFESMWSGHLWTIKATEHRIKLLQGSKPVHQTLYRAVFVNELERDWETLIQPLT